MSEIKVTEGCVFKPMKSYDLKSTPSAFSTQWPGRVLARYRANGGRNFATLSQLLLPRSPYF